MRSDEVFHASRHFVDQALSSPRIEEFTPNSGYYRVTKTGELGVRKRAGAAKLTSEN